MEMSIPMDIMDTYLFEILSGSVKHKSVWMKALISFTENDDVSGVML
jgi:hypothetical protein